MTSNDTNTPSPLEISPIVRPVTHIESNETFQEAVAKRNTTFYSPDKLQLSLLTLAEVNFLKKSRPPEKIQEIAQKLHELVLPSFNEVFSEVEVLGIAARTGRRTIHPEESRSKNRDRLLMLVLNPPEEIQDERHAILGLADNPSEKLFSRFTWFVQCGIIDRQVGMSNQHYSKMFSPAETPNWVTLGPVENGNQ